VDERLGRAVWLGRAVDGPELLELSDAKGLGVRQRVHRGGLLGDQIDQGSDVLPVLLVVEMLPAGQLVQLEGVLLDELARRRRLAAFGCAKLE
jgi:hypothetical protein